MFGKSLGIAAILAGAARMPDFGVTGTPRRIRARSGVTRLQWPATCTTSQKTRNPSDPAQAYLIARAEAKRAFRAMKLDRQANRSACSNRAHYDEFDNLADRFNPFYIAK